MSVTDRIKKQLQSTEMCNILKETQRTVNTVSRAPQFNQLNKLPLSQCVKYRQSQLMFKAVNIFTSDYTSVLLKFFSIYLLLPINMCYQYYLCKLYL